MKNHLEGLAHFTFWVVMVVGLPVVVTAGDVPAVPFVMPLVPVQNNGHAAFVESKSLMGRVPPLTSSQTESGSEIGSKGWEPF